MEDWNMMDRHQKQNLNIPNKDNDEICFDVPTPFKEWYKKRNSELYLLYANNFESTKSNMKLAEKIAKENGFTECKNGLR